MTRSPWARHGGSKRRPAFPTTLSSPQGERPRHLLQSGNVPYVVSEAASDEHAGSTVYVFGPRADGQPIEDTEPGWAVRAGPRVRRCSQGRGCARQAPAARIGPSSRPPDPCPPLPNFQLDDRALLEVKRQGQWIGFRSASSAPALPHNAPPLQRRPPLPPPPAYPAPLPHF